MPRASRDPDDLRSGAIDLDLLVVKDAVPGILAEPLFEASFVGVVRRGHPLGAAAAQGAVDAGAFVAWQHIATSPGRRSCAAVDAALAERGLRRTIALVAPGFQAALSMAVASDCVAVMPAPFVRWAMATMPLQTFDLPFPIPAVEVAQCWHLRQHADPVHAWLRGHVKAVCAAAAG